ncbi:unnamed protein product [Leptosia nina]|uniref:Uncharacterized protein n=1 Tax=Leptosia nina TaxID=320188 RepID=A0AAV1K2D4_9NEOP
MEKHCDILENEKFGRYLVANKDLDADTPPLCLGCYCPVDNIVCTRCGWPICSEACEKTAHHQSECDVFSAANVRFQATVDWSAASPQLDCITPLRMLIAKENDPDRWQRELEMMETHTDERKKRQSWEADQNNILNFLLTRCKLGAKFSKDLIEKVCGILAVDIHDGGNSQEVTKFLSINI